MPPEIQKLSETINYEEDKEVSPERDDEKPIMDSSDGPIVKPKLKFGQQRPVNKGSNNNNMLIGESFGMNPLRMTKGGGTQESRVGPSMIGKHKIEDNFLEEDEDDYRASIAVSRESGEIDPRLWK